MTSVRVMPLLVVSRTVNRCDVLTIEPEASTQTSVRVNAGTWAVPQDAMVMSGWVVCVGWS